MSAFWIHPSGVRQHAAGFDEWAEMVGSGHRWVENHTIENMQEYPAYQRGASAAITLRGSLLDWLGHLETVLRGVGAELREVADEAEAIDLEQQAELDAVDPDMYAGFEQDPSGSSALVPSSEQIDDNYWYPLPPPGGGAGFYCDLGSYDHLNALTVSLVPDDLLSPSEWVWTILGWVGAQDISDMVLEAFGGRWGDLREFADTLRGLADMMQGLLDSVHASVTALALYWQGFAADSAQAYFAALQDALTSARAALANAALAFSSYSDGVEQTADSVEGLCNALTDAVLVAVIAAIAGTVLIETGVGPIAGYGTAAVALWRATSIVYEIRGKVQELSLLFATLQALGDVNADLSDFTSSIPVPAMVEAA